jgi:ribonuclease P protein component
LIRRIRDRQRFERLARDGKRFRRRSLWCTWCPEPDSTHPTVAFAIGRAYGPAVTRNRLRRRLRAILAEIDRREPLPVGAWLIGARPSAGELTFGALTTEMSSLIEEVRRWAGSSA